MQGSSALQAGIVPIVTSTERPSPQYPRTAILLATYNGETFLREQLETLRRQQTTWIDIWASDDGSSDRTREILEEARAGWRLGNFRIVEGPHRGFAENFRSLILNGDIVADYYAFCDQDDLWDSDKLSVAMDRLKELPAEEAGLYCSRTRTIDLDGRPKGYSPLFSRPPTFRNAIVQSIAGANTMVLNRSGWALLVEARRENSFVSHDWWTYLVVTGAGGAVHYSPQPRIGYRQHPENLVGIDDWSWRRATRYGTIVVDLERRSVIDILDDRSVESAAKWLRNHHSTEVVSRDCCGLYAQSVREGAPQARQVADRFHLVPNLRTAI
jgi:glycosyltransferase involved in cell wall biosynthesis